MNYWCWPAAAAAVVQITGPCKKDKEKTAAEVTNMLVDWPLHKDRLGVLCRGNFT